MADGALNPQLPRRLHFHRRTIRHLEISLGVFVENFLKGLLEERRIEGISHHHQSAR